MTDEENRVSRLKKILWHIELNERYEHSFDKLYELLTDEYHIEGGKSASSPMGSYNFNLGQTIDKQARVYKEAIKRKPKKGALSEYRDFVNNFKRDVQDELTRCEYTLRSSLGK